MGRYDIILGKTPAEPPAPVKSDYIAGSDHVYQTLSSYLEKDINFLLNQDGCDAVVFGGAVRDCIAPDNFIRDVDIMALPRSALLITNMLAQWGFTQKPFASLDIAALYSGIKKIHEPWTFVSGEKIVQVIRPINPKNKGRGFENDRHAQVIQKILLSQVDISACGVVYNGFHVQETCQGAINDCLNKRFHILPGNAMLQEDRIHQRVGKLMSRGWTQYGLPGQKTPLGTFSEMYK